MSESSTSAEPSRVAPGRLVAVRGHRDHVVILVEVGDRDVPIEVPIDPATAHALRQADALRHHPALCQRHRPTYVDLLLRSIRATGAWPMGVVVRPGPEPAFWLRMVVDGEPVEIDLHVFDAVVLLLANRLPVLLTDGDHDPWQETIDRLLGRSPAG